MRRPDRRVNRPGFVGGSILSRVGASGKPGAVQFGQGEWCAEKYGRLRRRWLKLHIGVDAATGEIAAHVLTDGDEDDAAQVPDLLRQCEGAVASLTADGAYDRDPVYQAAAAQQRGSPIEVAIPPRADAVLSTADLDRQTARDRHIQLMAERGRIGWQRATRHGKRNHAEMVCLQTTNSA